MSRIGIFSGSFDPVHAGHIAFALQAIEVAKLDQVYFSPEAQPRVSNSGAKQVSHIAHRVTMLQLAVKAHPKLSVIELPDKQFTVAKTLPRLQGRFQGDELFLLCGSDMLEHMPSWRHIDKLLANMGLIVGVRDSHSKARTRQLLEQLHVIAPKPIVVVSSKPDVSAGSIRAAVARHRVAKGLLSSTRAYIDQNWLYTSVPESIDSSRSNS